MNAPDLLLNGIVKGSTGFLCVIANFIIIYIALRSHRFLTNFTNFTIFQLALADIIFGTGMLIRVVNDIYPILRHVDSDVALDYCTALLTPHIFGFQMRQFTVIFIATDKLFAIRFPITYRNISQLHKILINMSLAISYATITSLCAWFTRIPLSSSSRCRLFYIFNYDFMKYYIGAGVVITIIVFGVYFWSWLITHTKNKNLVNKRINNVQNEKKNYISDYGKVNRTIGYVIINYMVLWAIPQAVFFIFMMFGDDHVIASDIFMYASALQGLHSCINLLIYICTYQEMRRLFSRHVLRQNVESSSSNNGGITVGNNNNNNLNTTTKTANTLVV